MVEGGGSTPLTPLTFIFVTDVPVEGSNLPLRLEITSPSRFEEVGSSIICKKKQIIILLCMLHLKHNYT